MKSSATTHFKRPNFFVIGAEKAGTTSLCELLSQHPDVFFSQPKEPSFFMCPCGEWQSLQWYESLFASAGGCTAVGEGSTTYSKCQTHPGTARRIAEYAPDARIIYIVRHPLRRLESQWIQRRSMSLPTHRSFAAAVQKDRVLLDASLYWRNLSVYRDHFDDSRILVLFLEDMKANPSATLQSCFEFLQVDPDIALVDLNRVRNSRDEKREERGVLRMARRLPLFSKLRDRLLSQTAREIFRTLLTRPIGQRPEWEDDARAWFLKEIAADNARLLKFAGKPTDYWQLNDEQTGLSAA